jgi:hypothetical protein
MSASEKLIVPGTALPGTGNKPPPPAMAIIHAHTHLKFR